MAKQIINVNNRIEELTKDAESKQDKTTKTYAKLLEQIENRHNDNKRIQKKIQELEQKRKELKNYDYANGELEVMSFSFSNVNIIQTVTLVSIREHIDKKGGTMCFAKFKGVKEFDATVFSRQYKRWKKLMVIGNQYQVFIKDKILQDIKVVN